MSGHAGVVVRRADPADAAAASGLVRRSIVELCVDDHRRDQATLSAWLANKSEQRFAAWMRSERHFAVIAERAGEIVGFGLLDRGGSVELLYVAPETRYAGVSSGLLNALEREAASSGITELTLLSSGTALAFYERRGYVRTGEPVPGFGITLGHPLRKRILP